MMNDGRSPMCFFPMPNRILREGIIESEDVNKLSWPAEVFYRRLMSKVDDFGRYDANARLLRAALYPLKLDKVSDRDTQGWLQETEAAGLVKVYEVDSKRFLEVLKFKQQVRAKRSKYPDPPGTCTAHAQHMLSTCTAHAQHMRTKTEAETESNNNTMVRGSTTVDMGAAVPAAPPPPADSADGFGEWLGVMCGCVRAFREARCLHPEVVAEARAAYERFPRGVEYAPLLRAYYDSRLQEDKRRKEFWRPQGGRFFRELEDVVYKHAVRWQREVGWKPQCGVKAEVPVEGEEDGMTLEEKRAAMAKLREEVGL